jgi:hypothetical protein
MTLRKFLIISGCGLVIVGTVGLLLNELVWGYSATRTIIFAVVDFVGLVNMAFANFAMKGKG